MLAVLMRIQSRASEVDTGMLSALINIAELKPAKQEALTL
jgi:hypothetical protein